MVMISGVIHKIWTQKAAIARALAQCFLVFHLVAIPIAKNFPEIAIARAVYPYLVWTRLLQEWSLFVPAPRTFAQKYSVEIQYQDGSTGTWSRPYPPQWDFFERHLAYHFQKWDLATARLEQNRGLWLDLVLFLEFHLQNPDQPIVQMQLIRHRADRPPPREEGYVFWGDEALQWTRFVVFTYDASARRFIP